MLTGLGCYVGGRSYKDRDGKWRSTRGDKQSGIELKGPNGELKEYNLATSMLDMQALALEFEDSNPWKPYDPEVWNGSGI